MIADLVPSSNNMPRWTIFYCTTWRKEYYPGTLVAKMANRDKIALQFQHQKQHPISPMRVSLSREPFAAWNVGGQKIWILNLEKEQNSMLCGCCNQSQLTTLQDLTLYRKETSTVAAVFAALRMESGVESGRLVRKKPELPVLKVPVWLLIITLSREFCRAAKRLIRDQSWTAACCGCKALPFVWFAGWVSVVVVRWIFICNWFYCT